MPYVNTLRVVLFYIIMLLLITLSSVRWAIVVNGKTHGELREILTISIGNAGGNLHERTLQFH